jgi:hypothetical protein
MRLTSSILALSFALAAAGCEREPAIVVRFDARDLAGPDAGKPKDASAPIKLANDDAGVVHDASKLPLGPACKVEADCTLIVDGCCDCANGGKLAPALKRDETKLTKAHQAACKNTMCTMMVSTDKSCGSRPACVDGHCALRPARADEKSATGIKLPQ